MSRAKRSLGDWAYEGNDRDSFSGSEPWEHRPFPPLIIIDKYLSCG